MKSLLSRKICSSPAPCTHSVNVVSGSNKPCFLLVTGLNTIEEHLAIKVIIRISHNRDQYPRIPWKHTYQLSHSNIEQ